MRYETEQWGDIQYISDYTTCDSTRPQTELQIIRSVHLFLFTLKHRAGGVGLHLLSRLETLNTHVCFVILSESEATLKWLQRTCSPEPSCCELRHAAEDCLRMLFQPSLCGGRFRSSEIKQNDFTKLFWGNFPGQIFHPSIWMFVFFLRHKTSKHHQVTLACRDDAGCPALCLLFVFYWGFIKVVSSSLFLFLQFYLSRFLFFFFTGLRN